MDLTKDEIIDLTREERGEGGDEGGEKSWR